MQDILGRELTVGQLVFVLSTGSSVYVVPAIVTGFTNTLVKIITYNQAIVERESKKCSNNLMITTVQDIELFKEFYYQLNVGYNSNYTLNSRAGIEKIIEMHLNN